MSYFCAISFARSRLRPHTAINSACGWLLRLGRYMRSAHQLVPTTPTRTRLGIRMLLPWTCSHRKAKGERQNAEVYVCLSPFTHSQFDILLLHQCALIHPEQSKQQLRVVGQRIQVDGAVFTVVKDPPATRFLLI